MGGRAAIFLWNVHIRTVPTSSSLTRSWSSRRKTQAWRQWPRPQPWSRYWTAIRSGPSPSTIRTSRLETHESSPLCKSTDPLDFRRVVAVITPSHCVSAPPSACGRQQKRTVMTACTTAPAPPSSRGSLGFSAPAAPLSVYSSSRGVLRKMGNFDGPDQRILSC